MCVIWQQVNFGRRVINRRQATVENFKSVFSEAHAELLAVMKLDLHTEVVVSPEDDIELRRLRIHNRRQNRRTIEFTSYAEIVLAPQAADQAQPAFSNLFVETELLPEQQAILATRRPRDGQKNFAMVVSSAECIQ